MKINKKSVVCISIASNPGDFGANFHNSLYKTLNMNWIYLPRKVLSRKEVIKVIDTIRVLDIRGCSVSMPHKEEVINFIDDLDLSASKIGAVNTIVNNSGKLKGYNTDYYGAKMSLEKAKIKGKSVLMLGAGGVAKAVGLAVKDSGGILKIANRSHQKAIDLANKLNAETILWEEINLLSSDVLINATSVGMLDPKKMIIEKDLINNYNFIMDVVIYPPESKLLKTAISLGKKTIPGTLMCVYQAAKQFKLYTGLDVPNYIIDNRIASFA